MRWSLLIIDALIISSMQLQGMNTFRMTAMERYCNQRSTIHYPLLNLHYAAHNSQLGLNYGAGAQSSLNVHCATSASQSSFGSSGCKT